MAVQHLSLNRKQIYRSEENLVAEWFFDGDRGSQITLAEDFDFDSGVTNSVNAEDTTYYDPRSPNSAGRRITPNAGGFCNFAQDFSPNLDLTNRFVKLEFYVHEHGLQYITSPIYTNTTYDPQVVGLTAIGYDNTTNQSGNAATRNQWNIGPGWNSVVFDPSVIWTSLNKAEIRRILFQYGYDPTHHSNHTGAAHYSAITFTRFAIYDQPSVPKLILRMDDAYSDHFDDAAYAKAAGFNVVLSVYEGAIDTSGLTTDELISLYNDGHYLVNHAKDCISTTGGNLTGWKWADGSYAAFATLANRVACVRGGRNALIDRGLGKWANIFVVPGGEPCGGSTEDGLYTDEIVLQTSGTADVIWYGGAGDPFLQNTGTVGTPGVNAPRPELYGQCEWYMSGGLPADECSQSEFDAWLTRLKTKRGLYGLYGHTWPEVTWEYIIDSLETAHNAGEIEVIGLEDIYNPQTPVMCPPGKRNVGGQIGKNPSMARGIL